MRNHRVNHAGDETVTHAPDRPDRPESRTAPPRKAQREEQGGERVPKAARRPREIGGPSGPEPTRYGDWERKGICVDF